MVQGGSKNMDGTASFYSKQQVIITLAASTIVLGILVGLSSLFLGLFLEWVEQVFLHYEETAKIPSPISTAPRTRLLSVTIGGVIAAIIWWLLRTKSQPMVSIKQTLAGEQMPWWQTVIHVITQIFYVGVGGSIGRELAPREAGALLAQRWQSLLAKTRLSPLSTADRQLLIAAAAGAGFAGIYIAPITGMLFCVEVLLKKLSLRTVTVSLTMSTIAMFVGSTAKGFKPYYLIGDAKFSLASLVFVLLLAPICGLIGGLCRQLFQWAEKRQTKNSHILWQLPLIAVITGLVSLKLPEIMGNGRSLAQLAINSKQEHFLIILLLGAIGKIIITTLTIRFGAAGGTLTPAIAIGAVVGAAIGLALLPMFPALVIWQCAVIGACTLLAASQQAPFMALFMIIEICHLDYSAFLPLAIGTLLSIAVSKQVIQRLTNKRSY